MSNNTEFTNYKKSEISRKRLTIKELESLSIFLSRIFKKSLYFQLKKNYSVEFLNWLYNENPNGKAITYNVYDHNNDIIAHFALVPIFVIYKKKNTKVRLLY